MASRGDFSREDDLAMTQHIGPDFPVHSKEALALLGRSPRPTLVAALARQERLSNDQQAQSEHVTTDKPL